MVSGLVTSPCDQERIFSGEASWILMASKSMMGPRSSKGLERNIVGVSVSAAGWLRFKICSAMTFGASRCRWFWCWCLSSIVVLRVFCPRAKAPQNCGESQRAKPSDPTGIALVGCCECGQRYLLLVGELDQLDVEAQRL